ncbi:MAG: PKD domain-containing protein [Planctomycetota bacterium]|nr:PKD domain-containing protein [Planctomycetota bacterium]
MPSHVFLEPGIYPVTLKVTDENGASNSVTHRIKAIYTVKPIDRGYILEKRAKEFLADISDHDPALLKADQLIALWNFYELVEDETARRAFAMEFLKRLEDLPPDEIGDIAVKVGDFILEQMGMPDKALTAYEAVASSAGIITRSRGLIRKGDVYLFYKDDPRKARELYSKAVELLENTGADELRFAYIRMGDASKYFGQLEDAQNWYGKAEAILLQGRTPRRPRHEGSLRPDRRILHSQRGIRTGHRAARHVGMGVPARKARRLLHLSALQGTSGPGQIRQVRFRGKRPC